ncbi:hypothetical protein FOPG_09943 [Fusarium oxysporum f. sp. conglutinans race 2 54008]|nr:hypothetical protein FOPG_09943 [Fusarium oxysporum f. sp. conglutinans race 2 54008]KAI8418653.1 hypothetical protein FOFC_01222 [Fusarium oxysporum]
MATIECLTILEQTSSTLIDFSIMPTAPSTAPYRQVRACYNDTTIIVYQAYKESIAKAAVDAQKLNASPDFKSGRMTWIKPSWAWMMYRAGYSYKDPGQSRILALRMKHEYFITLLERGVLSSHAHKLNPGEKRETTVDVRIQWDPERTAKLEVLPYRSIQIGIPGALSKQWANEWIVEIEDVTDKARELKRVIDERPGITDEELLNMGLIFEERPFEVPEAVHTKLEMTDFPV